MAKIIIETSKDDQEKVLGVLRGIEGEVTAVSAIAEKAGLKSSKVRYVLMDLIEQGRIEKVPYKAFNKHYVRYSYNIVQ